MNTYTKQANKSVSEFREWSEQEFPDGTAGMDFGVRWIQTEALVSIANSLEDILFELQKMNGGGLVR